MKSARRQAFLTTAAPAIAFATIAAVAGPVPQAWANGFNLGGAANYEILFEGNGGNTLQFNNSITAGNVGIGGSGTFQGTSGLITGAVQFSAANTGQYNNTGALVLGGTSYNSAAVASALNTVNALSQSLGQEAGTAVSIASGGSVNATSGKLDANGNYVFTVNALNFPNGTFTVNGTANQKVVFNVANPGSGFNGQILLAGGITSSNVLFNIIPSGLNYSSDYASLSGGPTLSINTNGAITFGDFLDPTGAIQITKSILDGSVFGGDSKSMAIMSDVTFNFSGVHGAPGPTAGAGLPGLIVALGLLGLWRHRRRSAC